ncbi:Zinc finger BED domain-containing protein 4 [Labeo rohita]|uniref:Zinc finger BED domain-containing protein 4 n=2 Tax=Labeo rohita TaxID=84645 RepID=A0ABQ8LYA0_LABRO|nr:Zinc finger BED domain-containing protein 4 [Labeo rohita]
MERAKESAVWRYFMLAAPTCSTAVCNVCKGNVLRGGGKTATFNTTNLIKHLQKHHAKEHAKFLQLNKTKGKGDNTAATAQQLTLADALQRREKFPTESLKALGITQKVLEFIVLDAQPMSFVEDEGFRRLLEYLEPRYSLPSRKYFSETALPELYKKVCEHISKEIKDVKSMSFTTDIWSSAVCPMSLLSLTVHWLDVSCTRRGAMLQAKNFHGSHTSDTISAAIKEMLDQWHIPLNKVHLILRDNASNIKKAMDNMGVRSLGCFAHTLQLVVNEGLLSQRSVSDAIAIGRQIVGHFKHSPLAYSRLQDIQLQMQMQPKRLQQDVKTRWNSTYLMIQSLLEQKRVLGAYIADNDLPSTLTANQWALLEKTSIVLAPFEELTRKVSSATASTADVIPAVTVLKRILAKEGDADTGIKTMKKTLLEAVNRRFDSVEDEPLYALATLLDPRYKDRYFTSAQSAMSAKDALTGELEELEDLRSSTAGASEAAEPQEKAPRVEAAAAAPSKSSFMQEFDQIVEECEDPSAASSSSPAVQLHGYLAEKTIATSDNPYQYWGVNKYRLPCLAATATKYLCAPCTSVESERVFSTVFNIVDEKRNRLTAERTEMLVFMRKNLPLLIK